METSIMRAFEFQNHPVRIEMVDGEPWWVAKDVAEAMGYVWNGTDCIRHVPDQWRGIRSVLTPSGVQQMAVLSEQGIYFFLGRSNKPDALPFQMWIAGEVVPSIRKTGQYSVQKTTEEMLLESVQVLVDHQRKLAAMDTRITAIEQRGVAATKELFALPSPEVVAPQRTTRTYINEVVRAYGVMNNCNMAELFGKLYREVRDRYHVDFVARSRNSGKKYNSVLHYVEENNPEFMKDIYGVAHELYATE